ncbi:MAG: hypothetical protein QM809_10305 [Gordonia sp. (in: high G+C Gram-positive bacteria)]|uniref:hypothetical protein n=1 Tax=Gordonia sp. (in: high G+C Gram-positive bacteria) TaxID=84139 RepID=UPI0039E32203
MSDHDDDAQFARTQHIGDMVGALAEAELIVAAVDTPDEETRVRLDRLVDHWRH